MNWFSGTLVAKCIRGRTYTYHDVSSREAQEILDVFFEDRLKEAIYTPSPISMAATCNPRPDYSVGPFNRVLFLRDGTYRYRVHNLEPTGTQINTIVTNPNIERTSTTPTRADTHQP